MKWNYGTFSATILFDNQRRLNPNAVLLFHGPDNLEDREETEDEDQDEEDMPNEEIEDEVPDEHERVEYRYALPSGINERMEIQNGTDQLDNDGDESDQDFEAGQEQEQGDDMDSDSSGDGEMEDNELPELMADVQTEPDLEADTDADEQWLNQFRRINWTRSTSLHRSWGADRQWQQNWFN